MRLNYNITEELYAEVIAYQMRLHNNQKSQILKYWISNVLFCGFALYFMIVRTEYAWWLRLMPLLMAAVLLVLSTHKRVNLPKRAKAALKRYMRDKTLEAGFIGPHTLVVEKGMVRRGAGTSWTEVSCDEVGNFLDLEHSELMTARGVIFELIPRAVLDADGNREKLHRAIEEGHSDEAKNHMEARQEALSQEAEDEVHWKVDEAAYIRGMVEGHRRYYRTRQAWKGSQTVRMIIFLYGVIVLCMRLNLYIGLAFVLIGILLNRQLLVTFSPLSYWVVRKQVEKIRGMREDLGEEIFYVSEKKLTVLCMGETQSTDMEDISNWKTAPGYTFLYTKSGQMYVIPDAAFSDVGKRDAFLKKLKLKK